MQIYFLVAFGFIVFIQCSYYLIYLLNSGKNKINKTPLNPPISVLVCAKNEEKNLLQFLPLLFEQVYQNEFEIVVINDRSSDETAEVLVEFSKKHANLKIVTIEECESFWGNKKYALTLGIKAAKNEHLLFIDADCKPVSKFWIQEMANHFSNDKKIILGYGAYQKVKNSFLNKIIRYETLITAIQYFSYAKMGNPYMGVGRNLAYTKSEFYRVNGFIKHIHITSGDDDLFVNEAANSKNTSVCYSKNSFTESVPKFTFKSWDLQKRRHITTVENYRQLDRILLGAFYGSQFLFLLMAILLLSFQIDILIVLGLILTRYVFYYAAIIPFSKKLKENDLLPVVPFIEIVLIFMQFVFFFKNRTSTPKKW